MNNNNLSIQDKAEAAMKKAISNVIAQHKISGRPLAVWKNGKTILVSPDSIE